jgi:hypothetical protein
MSCNNSRIYTHRTIILPGIAIFPGQTLIPKRRPAESLPLLEDPPAFFVAFRTVTNVVVVVDGLQLMDLRVGDRARHETMLNILN